MNLIANGVTKRYAVTVLDAVDFHVKPGEIHGLLGANGAGKSTLCRIIAGLTAPTSGTMTLNEQPYAPENKRDAEAAGVQIVQQELNLVPTWTVAENLSIGRTPSRWGIVDQRRLRDRAKAALELVGLADVDVDRVTGTLGVGRQQMVEIASALDRDCRFLILDEPTAALSATETDALFAQLNRLRTAGVGMIYISHRLDEVKRICDRVTILRDGRRVAVESTRTLSTEQMVDRMSGADSASNPSKSESFQSHATDSIAMRVENLCRGEQVRDVSFTVYRGERLGIAGLVGSGRTETLRAIFGADLADSGSVLIGEDAAPLTLGSPANAVEAGLAMVTEDRKDNGLMLSQSIRCNTSAASLWHRFARRGFVRRRDEQVRASEMVDSLETRCTGIEQNVGSLSGGNQQKVAVSKWLVRDADVFLFDEPTRGIDVAARRRIYRLLESLAADGKGLVIVSSDLPELFETCDRILVMAGGRLTKTLSRGDWSEDEVLKASFAHT